MEYEQFYKFLENRPVKELNDCMHRIVDMVGSRFVSFQPNVESVPSTIDFMEVEKARVEGILKCVITKGILMPHGMNGYHRKDMRFVRWYPGFHKPVVNAKTFSLERKLTSDWFLDEEFQVWLNWNVEGFYEMSRKDSLKFNQSQPANKHLSDEARNAGVFEKRKAESINGSEDRKRSRTAGHRPTEEPVRFNYLSGSSESGTDSAEDHVLTIKPVSSSQATNGEPVPADVVDEVQDDTPIQQSQQSQSSQPDRSFEQDKAALNELLRMNSVNKHNAATATPVKTAPPVKPIKGDFVYITLGKYAGTEGSVVGMRGMDGNVFRVQIANLVDGGSIIVQVPGEAITLSCPTASRTTDMSETYLSALKRSSEAPKPSTSSSSQPPTTPPHIKKSSHKESQKQSQQQSTAYEAEHEQSVDEFFNNLSGSDDYFKPQPIQVSDSSSPQTKPRHATSSDQSESVAAVVHSGGCVSEDSVPTQSLTSPPDLPREAEAVFIVESAPLPDPVVTTPMEIATEPERVEGVEGVATEAVPTTALEDKVTSGTSVQPPPAQQIAKKNPTGRPRLHVEGEEARTWSFKCKCGDVCSSYENAIYHPKGDWYECSQCSVWSHVVCMLGNASLEKVAEMPEVLCFSCQSKNRRNRSSRGAHVDTLVTAPDAVVTLPVKITTPSPTATALEKKRSPKRKAASSAAVPRPDPTSSLAPVSVSSAPKVVQLQPGQIVILLKGQHRGKEAEVVENARAGPVLLQDVYKLKLCSEPEKVIQMPMEFMFTKVKLGGGLQGPPSPDTAPTTAPASPTTEPMSAAQTVIDSVPSEEVAVTRGEESGSAPHSPAQQVEGAVPVELPPSVAAESTDDVRADLLSGASAETPAVDPLVEAATVAHTEAPTEAASGALTDALSADPTDELLVDDPVQPTTSTEVEVEADTVEAEPQVVQTVEPAGALCTTTSQAPKSDEPKSPVVPIMRDD